MKKLLIGLLAVASLSAFSQDSGFSFHCRKDARGTQAKDQCRYEKEDCLDRCETSYPEWRQVDGPCFW